MELFLKPETSSDFLIPFLEATSNFKHLEKKDDCHCYFISEIRDCEKIGETTL